MMKLHNLLVLCLLGTLLTMSYQREARDPLELAKITSFSPSISGYAGGTQLVIKGFGFSWVKSDNRVTVGGKECVINDNQSHRYQLSCVIPPHEEDGDLEIVVAVRERVAPCSRCNMRYRWSYTPFMVGMSPAVCWNDCLINFYGSQRVSALEDVFSNMRFKPEHEVHLDYDGMLCDKPREDDFVDDLLYDFDFTLPGGDSWNLNPCTVQALEAGPYVPSFNIEGNYGLAEWWWSTKYSDSQGDYTFRVIPKVTGISVSSGSTAGGQVIEVTGRGFAFVTENNQVWVGDSQGTVISSSEDGLVVATGPQPSDSLDGEFQSGNVGVLRKLFKMRPFGVNPADEGWTTVAPDLVEVLSSFETTTVKRVGYYSQMFEGIFTPKVDGEHTFLVSSDDQGKLIIDCGDETPTEITNTSANYFRYFDFKTNGVGSCNLTAGTPYPFTAYHYEAGGADHFTVGLLAPSEVDAPLNYVRPIQRMHIVSEYKLEVHEVVMNNASLTKPWQLWYNGKRSRNLADDSGSWHVANAFKDIGLNRVVGHQRISLNAAGEELSEITLSYTSGTCDESTLESSRRSLRRNLVEDTVVTGYKYIITLQPVDSADSAKDITVYNPSSSGDYSHTRLQVSSNPLRGQYWLSYNGAEIGPFDWNTGRSAFEDKLRMHSPLHEVVVYTATGTHSVGHSYYVVLPDDEFILEPSRVELLGGRCTENPYVMFTTYRDADMGQQFWPSIPASFLSTKHAGDNLQIKFSANGLAAACDYGACDYTYSTDATPTVDSWSNDADIFTIVGSGFTESEGFDDDADDVIFITTDDIDSITVTFGDSECELSEVTDTSITCTLASTVAGDHAPLVNVGTKGNALNGNSVGELTSDLVVTSISPESGSSQGGTELTIVGEGFPASLDSDFDITIDADGLDCEVTATSWDSMTCVTQATAEGGRRLAEGEVTLTVNGESDTLSFSSTSDSTPTIGSVSPATVAPYVKTTITITLTDSLDVTEEDITVTIGEDPCWSEGYADKVYTCWMIGSQQGTHDLLVHYAGLGYSEPQDYTFNFELTGISPSSGSISGGTLLTLTGAGFTTEDETNFAVSLGDTVDKTFCTIIDFIDDSTMTCRVQPPSDQALAADNPEVIVHLRATLSSICDDCFFEYSGDATPSITSISPETGGYGSITVTGTGFSGATSDNTTIMIGSHACASVSATSDTELVCTFSAVEDDLFAAGFHLVSVVIDSSGSATNTSEVVYNFASSVSALSPISGPTGRVDFTVTGEGFTAESTVTIGSKDCVVSSVTSTEIECSATINTNSTADHALTVGSDACSPACTYSSDSSLSISFSLSSIDTTTDIASIVAVYDVQGYDFASDLDLAFEVSLGGYTAAQPTIDSITGTATFTYEELPVGEQFLSGTYSYTSGVDSSAVTGWIIPNSNAASVTLDTTDPITSVSPTQTGIGGGAEVNLIGTGFDAYVTDNNVVTICGRPAEVVSATYDTLTVSAPLLISNYSYDTFGFGGKDELLSGVIISHTGDRSSHNVFDGDVETQYGTHDAGCYFGLRFQDGHKARLNSLQYFPHPNLPDNAHIYGSTLEGSDDGENWTIFHTFETTSKVLPGWNTLNFEHEGEDVDDEDEESGVVSYQYIRYVGHSASNCYMAEMQFYGLELYDSDESSVDCPIIYTSSGYTQSDKTVTLTGDKVATVTAISPETGGTQAQVEVTLTYVLPDGASSSNTTTVNIDGIECAVTEVTDTTITCTTGAKSTDDLATAYSGNHGSNIEVLIPGLGVSAVDDDASFKYIDLWSDSNTWGGADPPQKGFSVHIPAGQYIQVDISVPELELVIVEGTLEFKDQGPGVDITFDAHYIVVRNGAFLIGSEENYFQSNLTITLHGARDDIHLETFGNKCLAVMDGILEIHGKPRDSWTSLYETAEADQNVITLLGTTDWAAGEQIIIASTEYDHREAENMWIESVEDVEIDGTDRTVVTLTENLRFRHFAATETYGDWEIDMRAEVGLLTRNVKIQGDEATSVPNKYGGHIMLAGAGEGATIGRIEYVEVVHMGQTHQLGRYPFHFHMLGNVHQSYIRGCAIWNGLNRGITIHGVHYLTVEHNVMYNVMGHTVFLEDGIETNNRVLYNLVIGTVRSWSLLITDQTPANYWITNPNNHYIGNHAAGSDRYGFWFDLHPHPDGPSATDEVCPHSIPLGTFDGNFSHSMVRYGLRIHDIYTPKVHPCQAYNAVTNPAVQATFQNYTGWKNMRNGVIAEHTGALKFTNMRVIDNMLGGIEVSEVQDIEFGEMVVQGNVVVGMSNGNRSGDFGSMRGIVGPRTEGMSIKDIDFYNWDMPNGKKNAAVSTCSHCFNRCVADSGGRTIFTEGLTFTNVNRRTWFEFPWKAIIHDIDGSLTGHEGGWVTPYKVHNDVDECTDDQEFFDGLVCTGEVVLRKIAFWDGLPSIAWLELPMKLIRLPEEYFYTPIVEEEDRLLAEEETEEVDAMTAFLDDHENYTNMGVQQGKAPKGWSVPMVMGQNYKVHWKWGVDFDSIKFQRTEWWTDDDNIMIKFNHTDLREKFQVYENMVSIDGLAEQFDYPDATADSFGSFYLDETEEATYFLATGRGGTSNDLHLYGHHCWGEHCTPDPNSPVEMEDFIRYWDEDKWWREDPEDETDNATVPGDGDSAWIRPEWNMVLEGITAKLDALEVEGYLTFATDEVVELHAQKVLISRGKLAVGGSSEDFVRTSALIKLYGEREDRHMTYNPSIPSCNKCLVITAEAKFFGTPNAVSNVKLIADAAVGDSELQIDYTSGLFWKEGDTIVISPSSSDPTHYDTVTLASDPVPNADSTIYTLMLNEELEYKHIGTVHDDYGTDEVIVDARATVGLMSHNVKIVAEDNGWRGTIMVGDVYDETEVLRTAKLTMNNVEVVNMGQYESERPALRLINTGTAPTVVSNSSFYNSDTIGLMLDGSDDVTIEQCVIVDNWINGIYAREGNTLTIRNNLVLMTHKRELETATEVSSNYGICSEKDMHCTDITFTNNVAGGSEDWGIAIKFSDCQTDVERITGNSVFAADHGIVNGATSICTEIGPNSVFFSRDWAISSYVNTHEVYVHHVALGENTNGINLMNGHAGGNNRVFIHDSVIVANFSTECGDADNSCDSDGFECVPRLGIQLATSLESGKLLPIKKPDLPIENIKAHSEARQSGTVARVTFANFIDKCEGVYDVVVDTNDSATDFISPTTFTASNMINVTTSRLAWIDHPNEHFIKVDDCGEFVCTGLYNVIITDTDGTLLQNGVGGTIRSNGPGIAIESDCEMNETWNALQCDSMKYGMMAFESLDADRLDKSFSPIHVTNEELDYDNKLNNQRVQNWNGFYSANERLPRFANAMLMNYRYELDAAGTWPKKMLYLMNGNNLAGDDYVILYQKFTHPMKMGVTANGVRVGSLGYNRDTREHYTLEEMDPSELVCGSNKYLPKDQSLTFIIKGNDCNIELFQEDTLQVSLRLEMTVDEFWDNEDPNFTFADKMAALLGINPARVMVIDVRAGSVIIEFEVADEAPEASTDEEEDSTSEEEEETDETASLADLYNLVWEIAEDGSIADEFNADVLDLTAEIVLIEEDDTSNGDDGIDVSTASGAASQGLLWTVVSVFFIGTIAYAVYAYNKLKKGAKTGDNKEPEKIDAKKVDITTSDKDEKEKFTGGEKPRLGGIFDDDDMKRNKRLASQGVRLESLNSNRPSDAGLVSPSGNVKVKQIDTKAKAGSSLEP